MLVNPQVSLLDLTVEIGISSDVMWHVYTASVLCMFHVMTELFVGMVNENIEEDFNITCDEDLNTTCDDD